MTERKIYKTVFDGEWVSVRNNLNRAFPGASHSCEICGKWTSGPVWCSIKTRTIRCKTCVKPEQVT